MSTIFDKILDGEIPCHRVYEDEHVLAFLDINPLSEGHTLVIPKERKAFLHELSDEASAAIGRALPRIARAVLAATGAVRFRATAQSFWSNMMDCNNALEGGVVGELTPSVRDLYVITDPAEVANVNLADAAHNLDTGNANLTADVLGMASTATAAEVADLIDWARSERMGAPLHTQPLIIDYAVHHVKANGNTTAKVFKWKNIVLKPGKRLVAKRRHAIRPISTRVYYPGTHRVEIIANGRSLAIKNFELEMPDD